MKMIVLKDRLQEELTNNLSFWLNHVFDKDIKQFSAEVSIDGIPNIEASTGVMYLSRILFGASTAYGLLKKKEYFELADISYSKLLEFSNPNGGYYWAKNPSNKIIHDASNVNMAQAFVLYGLVSYAEIKPSSALDKVIQKQFDFIISTLSDTKNGGYVDGFNKSWVLEETPTKAFGTHLHLLEAFVKFYEYKENEKVKLLIKELITLITQKFITKDTFDCVHRFTRDWGPLPNEIWAGHNAECSWILCNAASVINNEQLINDCNLLSLKIMEGVIHKAWGKYGGVFNVLENNLPTENVKIWWVQAETVLGFLNCYRITKEDSYKTQAIDLINYISKNFISENGEWYTEIYNNEEPNRSNPIVHFWKSMYHTVRYYSEVNKHL